MVKGGSYLDLKVYMFRLFTVMKPTNQGRQNMESAATVKEYLNLLYTYIEI